MKWTAQIATVSSALAVVAAGATITANPASAESSDCPSARLCVYDGVNFTGFRIATASTNSCFNLHYYTFAAYVVSYVNNMSVTGYVWEKTNTGWQKWRTLPAGGFSSEIPFNPDAWAVCTGSANPANFDY